MTSTEPDVPTLRDYQVTGLLAAGAHGRVYAARSRLTGHPVALQHVDPEIAALPGFTQRLVAAARQAAPIQHPHLVATFDLVIDAAGTFVVMEPVPGPSLRRLAASAALAPATVLAAVDDVLGAVEALHARGLVHGDIAPERVLTTPTGAARLAGFAVCNALAGLPPAPVAPRSPYSSPERASGAPLEARADLYAVAAMTHELLTGELPESGTAAGPASIPAVATVLQRALAPDPMHRFGTATELRGAIAGAAEVGLGPAWRLGSDLGDLAAAEMRQPGPPEAAAPAAAAAALVPAPGRIAGFSVPPPPGSTVLGGATPPPPVARVPSEAPTGYLPPRDARPAAAGAPVALPPPRRRRRMWIALALAALLIVAGAATGLVLGLRSSGSNGGGTGTANTGPLRVGGDVKVTATPAQGGCNTTFHFVATGSLSGVGTLVYRWDHSDGQTTGETSEQVQSNERSFAFTHDWSVQGSQTLQETVTFRIVSPTERVVNQTVTYRCP